MTMGASALWACISSLLMLTSGVISEMKTTNGTIRRPNIIVFLADDFGYGDLSVYGNPSQEPGSIDQMAAEGMRFTQFYSVATFCTPSRASLLTGRFPQRSGMDGNTLVHLPCMNVGLPYEELTIPEILKKYGYTTGMVGKWHLGINKFTHNDGYYLPHNHGFDYVGTLLPHTLVWDCDTTKRHRKEPKRNKCFVYRNDTIIQQPIKLDQLTSSLVEDTQAFLYNNHDKPFFFYMSFGQTHTPMHGSEKFWGKSRRGFYGDQVNEMSWAVGEILTTLKRLNIDDNTLTIFTSDHGPHREMCAEGGSTGGLKGGKGNFNEGGVRIPAIMRWPGVIKPNTVSFSVLTLMDLLPTMVELTGGKLPRDRVIDGRSFARVLRPPPDSSIGNITDPKHDRIHDIIYFYCADRSLMAVRYKQYKIYYRFVNPNVEVATRMNCKGNVPRKDSYHSTCIGAVEAGEPSVFDLMRDPEELMPLPYKRYENIVKEAWRRHKQLEKNMKGGPAKQLQKISTWNHQYCETKYIPCCKPPFCIC